MRLVFISSVTAMTPLRTISVTTGSGRRLLLAGFARSFSLVFSFASQCGLHSHRPVEIVHDVPACAGTTQQLRESEPGAYSSAALSHAADLVRIERGEPRRDLGHEALHRARALLARRPVLADDQQQRAEAADLVVERP